MTFSKNLHWLIIAVFAISCARQSSPTGGPKDTIPPVLVRSIPPHESVNFHGNSIQLEFSEYIQLNAPKEQLIITPTVGKDYKITYRKNILKIQFEQPLQDSITYTFNFRDAVQDVTERNPVRNLTLAYSTGPYIDSLSIEGNVYDLLRAKPLADVTVALHPANDTFNIMKHPATYFTKTNKEGKFRISHLKPGRYFVYAFDDKNRNLVVNSRSESYGFISDYKELLDDIKDVSIGLIRLDAGPLNLTSARPYNTYFNVRTSKNLRTFTITSPDSLDLSYTFGENQANIRIYDTTDKDSIQFRLIALDSIDNLIDTTLYAKFLSRQPTPEKFTASIKSSSFLAHRGQLKALLHFTKPLKQVNFDSLYFQVDSLTRVNFTPEDLTWDPLLKTIEISKTLDPKLFYTPETQRTRSQRSAPVQQATAPKPTQFNELNLRPAAFISIENDSSALISQPIKPATPDQLAIINIDIRTEQPSYFVELLDNNYQVLLKIPNQRKVRFLDVLPGDYRIRLVIDRNNNGRWDPGNYFTRTEPEPIIYYTAPDGSTSVKGVKANWEIGTDGEMFITY